jgi:hypothetical protein
MSFFKEIAIPAAVVLSVVSMGSMNAAQAQSGKRIVVAMAPADLSPTQEAKPMRAAPAAVTPRGRRVAVAAPAARAEKPDCFWCNRSVYISGLTF